MEKSLSGISHGESKKKFIYDNLIKFNVCTMSTSRIKVINKIIML